MPVNHGDSFDNHSFFSANANQNIWFEYQRHVYRVFEKYARKVCLNHPSLLRLNLLITRVPPDAGATICMQTLCVSHHAVALSLAARAPSARQASAPPTILRLVLVVVVETAHR
jgi:hypothetical protein